MRTFKTIALSAATAAVIAGSGAGSASAAAPSAAAVQYEGTVVSVDRSTRTFRLRDSERGTIRIKVRRSTSFERISGFGGLQSGMRNIEATVRRTNGKWVALRVERSGAAGTTAAAGTAAATTAAATAATTTAATTTAAVAATTTELGSRRR